MNALGTVNAKRPNSLTGHSVISQMGKVLIDTYGLTRKGAETLTTTVAPSGICMPVHTNCIFYIWTS